MDLREKILKRQDSIINYKTEKTRVSILGVGGLGSNVAILLARAGIGHINLFDFDLVDYSNLNRQNFSLEDIGKKKTLATREKILATTPYVNVDTFDVKLDENNILQYLNISEIFVEAFDDPFMKARLFDIFSFHQNKYLVSVSGLAGMEDFHTIKIKQYKNITIYGDFESPQEEGLYSPNVCLYAALQAGQVLRIIRDYF